MSAAVGKRTAASFGGSGGAAAILRRWRFHALILSICSAVLTVAAVLNVDGGVQVSMPVLGELPVFCLWRRALAADCPGCGLTRCFIALAHADVGQAWRLNPAGLLVFSIMLYQLPFRGVQLWRLWHGKTEFQHSRLAVTVLIWAIIIALFAQWAVRLMD
ncbi:MAG: DUF2752 domain-containing protein [Pirellulales bacterium]